MKRYVKKLNKEVEFSQIQVHTELYDVLRDIKYQGKFKTFNETISWLVRSTNTLFNFLTYLFIFILLKLIVYPYLVIHLLFHP